MSIRRQVTGKRQSGNCATAAKQLRRGFAAFALVLSALMIQPARAELIVLAAPITGDFYYAEVAAEIFDFHVAYAKTIGSRDQVLILTDKGAYDRYAAVLGKDKVLAVPMADIWARDFGPSNAVRPIYFRYTAAGQGGGQLGQDDADAVQIGLAELTEAAGLQITATHLLNDGGNFVDDYAGNAVVSTKFLTDNGLSREEARDMLRRATGVQNVAFITADEQGGLEHADGVVSFVDTNTLIVNSYPEDPAYARQLRQDLEQGLPGVTIHEIVTPYDGSQIYDERFGSACGLYTNALVTPERIYFPQFGIPEDEIALAQVRAATSRDVVPVSSQQVCQMGGGVRCMSWQLRGANAEALLAYAASHRGQN
jgi:agmatine deiminase